MNIDNGLLPSASLLEGGGVLVEKLFCSFFNPVISLYIYYDQYNKIWIKKNKKIPAVAFHGNGHNRF